MSDIQEIGKLLDNLIAFLEEENDEHWLSWFRQSKQYLDNSDGRAINHVLQAYGSMGSFSDAYLMELTSQIYDLASKIKKEHDL